jgi:predicted DNA-binding protein (UPF0278 family)
VHAEVYRNQKQYPLALEHPHTVMVRVDAAIYCANVEWIRGRIDKYLKRAELACTLAPIYVVLDTVQEAVTDSSGGPCTRSCHAMKCWAP